MGVAVAEEAEGDAAHGPFSSTTGARAERRAGTTARIKADGFGSHVVVLGG